MVEKGTGKLSSRIKKGKRKSRDAAHPGLRVMVSVFSFITLHTVLS